MHHVHMETWRWFVLKHIYSLQYGSHPLMVNLKLWWPLIWTNNNSHCFLTKENWTVFDPVALDPTEPLVVTVAKPVSLVSNVISKSSFPLPCIVHNHLFTTVARHAKGRSIILLSLKSHRNSTFRTCTSQCKDFLPNLPWIQLCDPLARSSLWPLSPPSKICSSIFTTLLPEAERQLQPQKKNTQQVPICRDLKKRRIERVETRRLGTHVEKEPSSSNYALGHYSFVTTEIPPKKGVFYLIFTVRSLSWRKLTLQCSYSQKRDCARA